MAPNIESLTPEQLDAMEQAAIAQASAPAASMDLSKMSPEELDALEQQHLPQEPMEETEANTPWNRFSKFAPGVAGPLENVANGVETPEDPNHLGMFDDAPNSPKFMDRHPFARNMANLTLKDLPQMAAVGATKLPLVGAGVGAGIRMLGGGAYDNAEKFLQRLSDGDISGAMSGEGTTWLGEHPGEDAVAGGVGGALQAYMPSWLKSQADSSAMITKGMGVDPVPTLAQRVLAASKGQAELSAAQKAEIEGGQALTEAMGIAAKDSSLLNKNIPLNVVRELHEDKILLPGVGPAETEAKMAELMGGSTITGEKLPGTLAPKIKGLVDRIYQASEGQAAVPFQEIKDEVFKPDGAFSRIAGGAEATKTSPLVKAAFDEHLGYLQMEAANRTVVPTLDGPQPLGNAFTKLATQFKKLSAQEAKLTTDLAKLNKGPTTARALEKIAEVTDQLDAVTGEIENITVGTEKFPGLFKLKEQFDNPVISFPDVNKWKQNLYRQLKQTHFDNGVPIGDVDKGAIRGISSTLKNLSDDLAEQYGSGIIDETTGLPAGESFKKANRLFGNLSEFEDYIKDVAGLDRTGLVKKGVRGTAVDVAHAVMSPKQTLIGLFGKDGWSKHVDINKWTDGLNKLGVAKLLKDSNGVLDPGVSAQFVDQLPIIPKFLGLRAVDNLARSVTPYLEPSDANASEIDGLTNAIAANMLPPEQLQDPAATQQALAQAQQVLQPLNMAMTHGTREDVAAEMSLLTKEHPEVFAAPKTGIPGEVVVEGKVMFPHPEDGMKYSERVKRADLGTVEKSKIRSDVHWKGLVSKVIK